MSLQGATGDEVTAAREEAVDPDVASTSTQLMPKKGILKRASSQGTFPRESAVDRNLIQQPRQLRPSPDRFPDRPSTRIPKLTLTWSEKNAVAIYGDTTSDENTTETDDAQVPAITPFTTNQSQSNQEICNNGENERQTAILHDDEESEDIDVQDEMLPDEGDEPSDEIDGSITDSTGSSHIVGKWWFGKSTKGVPHCARWGCSHNHHVNSGGDNGDYLTPTQRRTKEIHHLRKQLKLAFTQLEDKDTHLNELRGRLLELESMIGSTSALSEQHQLMLRHKEFVESHEREKQKLIDQHEIRVRQLIQEAVEARAEMMKVKAAMKELQERKVSVRHVETMTENIEMTPEAPIHPEPPRVSSSFPPSPQLERATQPAQLPHEVLLQLQAYENEAVVWRTKAAQLEIVLKEQILKSQKGINPEHDRCRKECERLKNYIQHLEANSQHQSMVDSGIEANMRAQEKQSVGECYSVQCTERRKQLITENNQLLQKVSELSLQMRDYSDDVILLRNTVHSMEEESKKNFLALEQMSKEIEERTAEVQAANMNAVRLQNEIAMKTKAICYLEERHQVYRNVILDHNLVIKDESTDDWRRGFSDPRYVVNLSKRVQTDLTEETIRKNEVHFINLADKLKNLEEEFLSKKSDMVERFKEIEKDLLAKTALAESLTRQLADADREAARCTELHQQEREAYQERLNELGQMAESVPILQFEIAKLQQQRGLLECQLNNAKEEYDAGLEVALVESLKKYQEQSSYWAEKVAAVNANNEELRNELLSLKRAMEDLKLRTHVEKADMANRLASSIDHITILKKQINRKTRDVQVDAHPRVVSKYVACRPNARHKTTDIEKGDLFDEAEERLKLCQGELYTTRRQVEVLQQKLVDTVQTQVDKHMQHQKPSADALRAARRSFKEISTMAHDDGEYMAEIENLKEKLENVEQRNAELLSRMKIAESEKQNLMQAQKKQIAHLVAEFDVVRKELDQEIGRYENERRRLKTRVAVLEKVKAERDKIYERFKAVPINAIPSTSSAESDEGNGPQTRVATVTSSKQPQEVTEMITEKKPTDFERKSRMRKWLSVPYLFRKTVSLDLSTLRERNSTLARENGRLTGELIALRKAIATSINRTSLPSETSQTPSIHSERSQTSNHGLDLAADLNQVREDLENIIIQIDSSVNASEASLRNTCFNTSAPAQQSRERSSPPADEDELEHLRKSLKRSQEEREALSEQLDRLTTDFRDACRELDLYKHEPRQEALQYSQNARLPRSRSVEIGRGHVDIEDHLRWKEKAGTMFRELNRLRQEYRQCDSERRDLRLQLVMLRGELGLTQCQLAEQLSLHSRPSASIQSTLATATTSTSPNSERKKKSVRLLTGNSGESHSRPDSSSGTYATAHSFLSFSDGFLSASDPELSTDGRMNIHKDTKSVDSVKERFLSPSRARMLRRYAANREAAAKKDIQEHDEIIKEAAKAQIAALKEEVQKLHAEAAEKVNQPSEEQEKRIAQLEGTSETLRNKLQTVEAEMSDSKTSEYENRAAEDMLRLKRLAEEIAGLKNELRKRDEDFKLKQNSYELRISMLSRENEIFVKKIDEMEKERQEMYLVMFKKGKEAAEHDVQEMKTVDELTEDRIVLRFLHDAFYYYLMNKGDSREHLQAIMTMLNFSPHQKDEVYRKRGSSH